MASTCLSSRHLKRLIFAIGLIGICFASCRVFLSSAIDESAGTVEELKREIKLLGCIAGVFTLAAAYLGRQYGKKRSTFVGCGCLVCIGVALSFEHTLITAAHTAEGKSASGDSGSGESVFGEPGSPGVSDVSTPGVSDVSTPKVSDVSTHDVSDASTSSHEFSDFTKPEVSDVSKPEVSDVSTSTPEVSGVSKPKVSDLIMPGGGGMALLNSKTVQQWVKDFDKPSCRFKDNDHWPWPHRPHIGFGGNGASIEPPPRAEIIREGYLDRQAELAVAVNNCESEAKPMKCGDWADPDVAKRYTCSTTTSACKTCIRKWFDIPEKTDVGDLFSHFQGDVGAAYCRCASMSTPGVSDVSTPEVSDVITHEVSDASTSTHEFSDVSKPEVSDVSKPEVSDISTPKVSDVSTHDVSDASTSTHEFSDVSKPEVSDVSKPEVSDVSTSTPEVSGVSKPKVSDLIIPEVADFSTLPTFIVIVQVLIVLICGVPLLREPDALEFKNPTEDIEGAELADAEVAGMSFGAADPAVARSGNVGIIPQMRTVTCPPDATPGSSVTVAVTVDVVVPAGIHPGMQFDMAV